MGIQINRRLAAVFLLGFSSGLPLALTAGTLQAWYTVTGASLLTISFLAFAWLPYTLKFLWAPLVDRFAPPILGRRRGWMLLTQILLLILIILMAFNSPERAPFWLGIIAFLVVFTSATQDIAIDAYRTDILLPHERGLGAALGVAGYRVAMVVSGGLALIMAGYYGFEITYVGLAILMGIGILATLIAPEVKTIKAPQTLKAAIHDPFRHFLSLPNIGWILLFIVFYKLAEAFTSSSGTLLTTFLLREIGFSLATVGAVNKGIGIIATLIGAVIGGILLTRISLMRALLIFGILQALTNLSFMALAIIGKSYSIFVIAVAIDNLAAGLGMAALVAYMMSLCNPKYTATQFALLSSLSALPRIIFSPMGGWLLGFITWPMFFAGTFLLALPALFMIPRLTKRAAHAAGGLRPNGLIHPT